MSFEDWIKTACSIDLMNFASKLKSKGHIEIASLLEERALILDQLISCR